MPTRDNITAPTQYTAASTLRFDPSDRVTITVTGGAIYAQFATVDPPGGLYPGAYDFDVEERVMPVAAIYNWTPTDFRGRKIVGVRVRRKLPTDTPQVTLDA